MNSSAILVLIFALTVSSMPYGAEQPIATVASTNGSYAAAPAPTEYEMQGSDYGRPVEDTGYIVPQPEPTQVSYTPKSVTPYEAPVGTGYDVSGTSPSATADVAVTATATSIMDYAPTPTGYGSDKPATGSLTVDVTYNGQKHPCQVSNDLAQGSTPQCADQDGVARPTNPNDITSMFCFAIRTQIAALPGCEAAAKGGVLAAQVVAESSATTPSTVLPASQINNSSARTGSFHSSVAVALCLASAVLAITM